jgi:hypothetical protein
MTECLAGTWPKLPRRSFLAAYYYVYQTDRHTLDNGSIEKFSGNGVFLSHGFGFYYEYGLSDNYTLIVNIPINYNQWKDNWNLKQRIGFADIDFGVQYYIGGAPFGMAIQGIASIPAYSLEPDPYLGYHQLGAQLNVSVGKGFSLFGVDWWTDDVIGYKHFFGGASGRIQGRILIGGNLTSKWIVLAQVDGIHGITRGTFSTPSNPTLESKFSVLKGGCSVVYAWDYTVKLQIGMSQEFLGIRSGYGLGGVVCLWYEF